MPPALTHLARHSIEQIGRYVSDRHVRGIVFLPLQIACTIGDRCSNANHYPSKGRCAQLGAHRVMRCQTLSFGGFSQGVEQSRLWYTVLGGRKRF